MSYLIQTYLRYDQNGTIYKTIRTFDGYKETSYEYYVGGQLYQERKNFLYNGLKASWDSYSYQDGNVNDVIIEHVECEYLDNTFQRKKHQRAEAHYSNSQDINVSESYWEYDEKKCVSYKSYSNGVLIAEHCDYNYNDLHCTYKTKSYSSSGDVYQEQSYDIVYLDETYLREKSRLMTRKRYGDDGQLYSSQTYYLVYDFDGKKQVGYHRYYNGELKNAARDYHYDGLICYYYIDTYNDGEVSSTTSYEVEYLE